MKQSPVEIKGYREGLRIILAPEPPLEEVREVLAQHLDKFGEAFAGTGILLDVGERSLSDDELRQLQKLLYRRYGLEIRRVISESDRTRQFAEILKIAVAPTLHPREQPVDPTQVSVDEVARVIRQTVRAGQVERFYEGSILVLGDVNPGGEIIASGDIIVLGALRGIARAGCLGDTSSVIVALQLIPTQVRVAGLMARDPGERGKQRRERTAEIARVVEDQIVVDEYHGI